MPAPLTRTFFARHHLDVARDLVGSTLVWDGCRGIVVETEAYAIEGDPACHTASRPSARAFVEQHPPGTAYVYLNYGMYWLLNVLAGDGIVLFRALEPVAGLEAMRRRRGRSDPAELCSGPGKLGVALALGGADHAIPLVGRARGRHFLPPPVPPPPIETDVRVGISRAVDRPWRFLAAGHPHVSVPAGRAARRARRRRAAS